ncbi:ribulokinase [Qingshengfaniella alkalisoli]|uniref:Ribulokinase n=1 Tax=Qingshengfaniella alkalisoli TaxID=2599296 RepID=A0A5B8I8S9_9RHOB|nr:ribulokinase [Qingshengfaniella alkalisoli]QDY70485.1 ribulokinase [Qingshengfaniella alkalisoli]
MTLVAGADFGTLSVRVTIMDTDDGRTLGTGIGEYPLHRSPTDPLFARQSHTDQMDALVRATRTAIEMAGVDGTTIAAFAADTTGSSVIVVDKDMQPLTDYYLWCDHTAHNEAAEITELARAEGLEALRWCGGVYSHEWGYAKLLHFLRHNPDRRDHVGTALEHCDMVAATLCGITDLADLPRSICAMGHKWMWGEGWGGLPEQDFLTRVDPLLDGINDRLTGRYGTSLDIAGNLAPEWAHAMGLSAGIPIPIGAFDAHWDAIGTGCKPGDVVNVIGTSTCIIALGSDHFTPVEGICGAVPGSVIPGYTGIEAGQSATGDLFEAIARRAGTDVGTLCSQIAGYGPGQSGLLRLTWDNGDRTVLVRSDLGGVTFGWDLAHSAADEMHAAIEGMAMHVKIIVDRMAQGGLSVDRIVNAGGIPQKNNVLNQVYADVLGKAVHVPEHSPVGVGACVFAALAAREFCSIEDAQNRLCPPARVFTPNADSAARYAELFGHFENAYHALGGGGQADLSNLLPALRSFRTAVHNP